MHFVDAVTVFDKPFVVLWAVIVAVSMFAGWMIYKKRDVLSQV